MKTNKMRAIPLWRHDLRKALRDMGGNSHWATELSVLPALGFPEVVETNVRVRHYLPHGVAPSARYNQDSV